jgi:ferredoxin
MAILKINDQEIEIENNTSLTGPSRDLGVSFGCETGVCGTCIIAVEEGMENLNEKNEKETVFCSEENKRLACQCKIKSGLVKIKLV